MSTVTKDIVIPPTRKILPELPADFPVGQAVLTVIAAPELIHDSSNGKNGLASLRGEGKDKVWMADDFDAPLEEFAEYM